MVTAVSRKALCVVMQLWGDLNCCVMSTELMQLGHADKKSLCIIG